MRHYLYRTDQLLKLFKGLYSLGVVTLGCLKRYPYYILHICHLDLWITPYHNIVWPYHGIVEPCHSIVYLVRNYLTRQEHYLYLLVLLYKFGFISKALS